MSPLMASVAALDESVAAYLLSDAGDASGVLASVLRLNNEVGRTFRRDGDSRMKSLQTRVNEVTVAAKKGDRRGLREATERVRDAVLAIESQAGGR